MSNIIDYIKWRGDLSFDSSPFTPVDNLIFSELSYLNFKQILKGQDQMTLGEIADAYLNMDDMDDLGLLLTGEFHLMLELMSKSHRYKHLIVKDCVEIIDEAIEIQFFAMTVELCKNSAVVIFRGTDDTLVGWKEDFKMSFLEIIPAQKEALKYVNHIAQTYKHKKIMVCGHSKGGNLAVFSAVHASKYAKRRITKIYNNDGPGVKTAILEADHYKEMSDRIVTLIPQSSIIGMLLEHEESYQVVKSSQKGALQHDGFTWEVMGGDFIYLTDVDDDSIMVDMTIKKVLSSMDLKQREDFTNTLFDVISVNENRTLVDIKKDGLKSLHAMLKNYNSLDKETKKALTETISLLFGEGFRSFLEVKNADQWNVKLMTWQKDVHQRITNRLSK